jgi:hypothetical protein
MSEVNETSENLKSLSRVDDPHATAWALQDNLKGHGQEVRTKWGAGRGYDRLGDGWFAFRCTDMTDTDIVL